MSEAEDNLETAAGAYQAFNTGGIDAILGYLDPEIEWRMWERFSRTPRVFSGHEGVREVLSMFEENYDDFRADAENLEAIGSYVLAPVRLHGYEKGSGEHHDFELVQVWTTSEGRAIRLDVYSTVEEARSAIDGMNDSGGSGREK